MAQDDRSTTVFTDDSGTRRRLLIWTVRATIGALGVAVVAVVFSLVTQVTLPGLDGPVKLPTVGGGAGTHRDDSAERSRTPGGNPSPTSAPELTGEHATPATQVLPGAGGAPRPTRAPTSALTDAAGPVATGPSAPGPVVPTSTKAAPGSKANHGAAATKSPRATPTPHGPTKTPPGRTK